jgi:hypothetical protein
MACIGARGGAPLDQDCGAEFSVARVVITTQAMTLFFCVSVRRGVRDERLGAGFCLDQPPRWRRLACWSARPHGIRCCYGLGLFAAVLMLV